MHMGLIQLAGWPSIQAITLYVKVSSDRPELLRSVVTQSIDGLVDPLLSDNENL